MLNNIVGYLYSGVGGGVAYIWNEVSVSTRGLIFGGLIFRSLRNTVEKCLYFLVIDTHFWVHIEELLRLGSQVIPMVGLL
jgi:hypothetical protein